VFQGVPRALIAFGVVTIAVLEIATRLPDIVLLPEKIDAAIGEYRAKSLQPKVVTTQVEKTEADTRLADAQTQLNAVQQAKTAAETRVAQLQAEVTAAQVAKTKADTELTRMQTALAATQAQKTQADTQLAQAQTDKTRLDTAQEGVGLALTAGIVGMGAALLGAGSQSQDAQQGDTRTASSRPVAMASSRPAVPPPHVRTQVDFDAEYLAPLVRAGNEALQRGDCAGVNRAFDAMIPVTSRVGFAVNSSNYKQLDADIRSLADRGGYCYRNRQQGR
jgi:hypothetical protein